MAYDYFYNNDKPKSKTDRMLQNLGPGPHWFVFVLQFSNHEGLKSNQIFHYSRIAVLWQNV